MTCPVPFSEGWRIGPKETNFYVRVYAADDAVAAVVFVHGAAEHCGRYTEMHSALAREHRISVFAFDLRGYGRTALDVEHKSAESAYGKTWLPQQLEDLEWAIEEAGKEFGGGLPLFVMGNSMGGTIVLGLLTDVARRDHDALKRVRGMIGGSPTVAFKNPPPAPVIWLLRQITRLRPWTLFPIRNDPATLSRNEESNQAYLNDPLVGAPGSLRGLQSIMEEGACLLEKKYANWPVDLPLLFMHGNADLSTSYPETKLFFEKIEASDKKMITYPGGAHELHFEPDGIREKSLEELVRFVHSHV
ncbi:lysophospholipase [Mycena filopes]|nr:lysophospholipase [Mycena filopes]